MESLDPSLSSANATEGPPRGHGDGIVDSFSEKNKEREEKRNEENTALTSSSFTFDSYGDAHTVDAATLLPSLLHETNDPMRSRSEIESTEVIAPLSLNSHYGISLPEVEARSEERQKKTAQRSSEDELGRGNQEEKEVESESRGYLEEEEEGIRRSERETEIGGNRFLDSVFRKEKEEEVVLEEVKEMQQKNTEKDHQSLADLYGLESASDDDKEEEEEGNDVQEASSDSEVEGQQLSFSSHAPLPSSESTARLRGTEDGLALYRVRELLRYEGSSTILSKDGVSMIAEAVGLIIQDLIRSAAEMAKRRRRRRVTAREIAQVISLYDRFSFLADVVPQPEKEKKDTVPHRPVKAVKQTITTVPAVDFWGRSAAELELEAKNKGGTESRGKTSTNTLTGHISSITVEEDEDNEFHTTHRQERKAEEVRMTQNQSRSFSFPHPSGSNRTEQSTLRF